MFNWTAYKKVVPPTLWLWVALVLLVMVWGVYVRQLKAVPFGYDEGTNLMFGQLANAGYPPYSVTFVGIPPLGLLTIQWGIKLFGITLAARLPMMVYGVLGVAAVFIAFYPWRGQKHLAAGFVAAVLLASTPEYMAGASSIMLEVPAVALTLVSLVCFLQYQTRRRLVWLPVSGVIFGLSLSLKLFMVFFPVLIGGLLLARMVLDESRFSWLQVTRRVLIPAGLWGLGVAIPWLIFGAFYDVPAMVEQIFQFRVVFRDWNLGRGASGLKNILEVGQVLAAHPVMVTAALLGLVGGGREWRKEAFLWLGWALLAVIPLAGQFPFRLRYGVMLLPPLAALSAVALVNGATILGRQLKPGRYAAQSGPLATTLVVAGGLGWLAATAAPLSPSPDIFPDLNLEAVQYVWQNTTPDDCIITDEARFALAANRLVPPKLSEASIARLSIGWLTTGDVIRQLDVYQCPAVVYAGRHFAEYLPDLHEQLRSRYFVKITFGANVMVYTILKHNSRPPSVPVEVVFGKRIALTGFDLTPPTWTPGREVRLATYWTAIAPVSESYKIFVQVRNSRGQTVVSADHFPFPAPDGNYHLSYHLSPDEREIQRFSPADIALYPSRGMLPTNGWSAGRRVREVIAFTLPHSMPEAMYHIYIGLYRPETGERLTVNEFTDEFLLSTVQVSR